MLALCFHVFTPPEGLSPGCRRSFLRMGLGGAQDPCPRRKQVRVWQAGAAGPLDPPLPPVPKGRGSCAHSAPTLSRRLQFMRRLLLLLYLLRFTASEGLSLSLRLGCHPMAGQRQGGPHAMVTLHLRLGRAVHRCVQPVTMPSPPGTSRV